MRRDQQFQRRAIQTVAALGTLSVVGVVATTTLVGDDDRSGVVDGIATVQHDGTVSKAISERAKTKQTGLLRVTRASGKLNDGSTYRFKQIIQGAPQPQTDLDGRTVRGSKVEVPVGGKILIKLKKKTEGDPIRPVQALLRQLLSDEKVEVVRDPETQWIILRSSSLVAGPLEVDARRIQVTSINLRETCKLLKDNPGLVDLSLACGTTQTSSSK